MKTLLNVNFDAIPAGWELQKCKHVGRVISGTGFPHDYQGTENEEIPFIKVSDMSASGNEKCVSWAANTVTKEIAKELGATILPAKSIIYAKIGAALLLNKRRILERQSCIDNNMSAFVPKTVCPEWALWWMSTLDFSEYVNPGAIPSFTEGQQRELPFLVPPEIVQKKIANYLDRETAHIDELVAEKEKMLALLEEKRAALISRAVTRGLDPDAPLKPSGLDWLGDIPAHWGTPPVYARFEVQLGKMLDEKKIKGTHLAPYLRNTDVQWATINVSNLPEMDFDDESRIRYSLHSGDILVCEGGEIGRAAIWKGELDECYYQKALHRMRSLNGCDEATFFIFVMRTLVDLCVFSSQANAATIQHLPAEKLRNIRYPSPPVSEQRAIVSFLNTETMHIDEVRDEIGKSIKLLRERRAALITAAVTGQIPVEEMRACLLNSQERLLN